VEKPRSKTIAVKLTPKASSDRIGEIRGDALTVYVTAPPDKNKANEAMLKLLAKHLDVAPTRLTLIKGHTNRNKLVEIH
jgi:uncharacterized protein (TIGR00251 family)